MTHCLTSTDRLQSTDSINITRQPTAVNGLDVLPEPGGSRPWCSH